MTTMGVEPPAARVGALAGPAACDALLASQPGAGSAVTIRHLLAAAERLAARERRATTGPQNWRDCVGIAAERLAASPFPVQPLTGFDAEIKGKLRPLVRVERVETLIEEAVRALLVRAVDPLLSDSVHGFRKGRSTISAAAAAAAALADGRTHVAAADIQDFFPSVPWNGLAERMRRSLPGSLADILMCFVTAPESRNGQTSRRVSGIPQGRATSPAISNLYLAELDRAMAVPERWTYLRYGDDLLILAKSPEDRADAVARLGSRLLGLGLCLNTAKSRTFDYRGDPFPYLGHAVGATGIYRRVEREALDALLGRLRGTEPPLPDDARGGAPRARTLYVSTPGTYATARDGLFELRRGAVVLRRLPVRAIDRVIVLAGFAMSGGFVAECVRQRIPVVFFERRNQPAAVLCEVSARDGARQQSQLALRLDAPLRLHAARHVVASKIRIQRGRMRHRRAADEELAAMDDLGQQAAAAASVEELLGLEGAATRRYLGCFAQWIRRAGFEFRGRTRRPPRDPINSIVSFASSLLHAEFHTAILAHALDPAIGVLHALHRRHPALASDLMDPYRASISDPFVLWLVNTGRVESGDFAAGADGGVYLSSDARRRVVESWERWMARRLPHGEIRTARGVVDAAVLAMVRLVTGEADELALPGGSATERADDASGSV